MGDVLSGYKTTGGDTVTQAKYRLLNQIGVIHNYLEDRIDEISEAKAIELNIKLTELWTLIERRKK